MGPTPCAVYHAYRTGNAGDALLVRLTSELLAEAGLQPSVLYAVNPHGFDALTRADAVCAVPPLRHLPGHAASGVIGHPQRLFSSNTELPVAIGMAGGYLRAGNRREAARTVAVHLPQLVAAKEHSHSIYLPQSVGPLRGWGGRLLVRELRRIDCIIARDDRTADELRTVGISALRFPDLAVLEIARAGLPEHRSPSSGVTVLVGRSIGSSAYKRELRRLGTLVPNPKWALQSQAGGTNDDRRFYTDLGITEFLDAGSLVRNVPGVLIATRLHAALTGILSGWPTVHLSYERKGFGAFTDLGLNRWLHNAFEFEPELVAAQAHELHDDPSDYFAALSGRVQGLAAKRSELTEVLRRVAARA